MSLLDCKDTGAGTVVRSVPAVTCWEGAHATLVPAALAVTLTMSAGLPLLIWVILRRVLADPAAAYGAGSRPARRTASAGGSGPGLEMQSAGARAKASRESRDASSRAVAGIEMVEVAVDDADGDAAISPRAIAATRDYDGAGSPGARRGSVASSRSRSRSSALRLHRLDVSPFVVARLGPLFQAYRPGVAAWYEPFFLGRRFVLAVLTVLLAGVPALRAVTVSLFTMLLLVVHLLLQPWDDPLDNVRATWGNAALVVLAAAEVPFALSQDVIALDAVESNTLLVLDHVQNVCLTAPLLAWGAIALALAKHPAGCEQWAQRWLPGWYRRLRQDGDQARGGRTGDKPRGVGVAHSGRAGRVLLAGSSGTTTSPVARSEGQGVPLAPAGRARGGDSDGPGSVMRPGASSGAATRRNGGASASTRGSVPVANRGGGSRAGDSHVEVTSPLHQKRQTGAAAGRDGGDRGSGGGVGDGGSGGDSRRRSSLSARATDADG